MIVKCYLECWIVYLMYLNLNVWEFVMWLFGDIDNVMLIEL